MHKTLEIHPSSLTDYADCARRSAARILWRDIREAGYDIRTPGNVIGATVGTAVHAGAQFTLETKILTGSLSTTRDAQDHAMAHLQDGMQDGVLWDDTTPNRSAAEKQTLRMVDIYSRTVAPQITPVQVEYAVQQPIKAGYTLVGTIDLLTDSALRDLKTGAERMHLPQIGAYHYMLRKNGHSVDTLGVDYIPRVAANKSQPPAQYTEYDPAIAEQAAASAIRRFIADHQEFERRLTAGQPLEFAFMANPSSMLCSPKYCPAFGTSFCREHKPKKDMPI